MINLILHSLQPSRGAVNFILAQLYIGVNKFEHRLPGTTKATPQDRGAYDSVREAQKAGITLDVLEKLFIQAIVDGYMQEWNSLRRQTPIALWEASIQEKGVPHWMGSQDDLKLLLMR